MGHRQAGNPIPDYQEEQMNRVLMRTLAVVAVLTSGLSFAQASAGEPAIAIPDSSKIVEESSTGSYIVVLDDAPLITTVGADNLDTTQADQLGSEMEQSHDAVLTDAGLSKSDRIQSFTNAVNGFAAKLTYDEAVAVANEAGVRMVLPDELRQVTTDSSGKFLGLTGKKGAYASGVTGAGVVVGVIDTGIWPEHPSFADTGFPAPTVVLEDTPANPACNFGNTAHNPNDAPFACNNKLIGARQMLGTYRFFIGADSDEFDSARDDNGHGTHTASTAAGDAGVEATILGQDVGEITGIAPDAQVIAYKALGNLGGFTSDLVSAIDQAVADGVDVINYSVGGGASLSSGDAIAFLFAADAGVLVATSAGNSGPNPATIGGPADLPWVTSVGASTQERFFEGEIKLGNDDEYKGASVTPGIDDEAPLVDAADAGGDLCIPGSLDPAVVTGAIVLCRRGATARIAKSEAVQLAGGVGMILYNNVDSDNLFTDTHWVPSVHIDNTPGLAIKAYIASAPNPTAKIETGDTEEWDSAPSMAIFSSRGENPSSSDLIKPDITAPGVQILAGASPFPDAGEVPGELFMAIAGTSMSSPHVAGLFALMDQVHPDWSAAMIKSALMTTSDQDVVDNDRVSQATPFSMGAGHADPGRVGKKGSAFRPGLVYDADLFDYAAFLCGTDAGVISSGFCGFLASSGYSFDASNLNVPSIGIGELAGSQTITRTVTSVANKTRTFKAKVKAPAGFTVTVNPSNITLAPGDSATFNVTITNDGTASVGDWSFGSLTWKGGGYKVFSPIAVRATLFNAPATVSGAGAAGTLSIPLSFGYNGAYVADPHGLVPATITTDTVVQDPDQNFDPGDGFSNLHQFDLTGADFFRLALPPGSTEANADLDVYVFDPAGNFYGASTAGGTDELIDIPLPSPGMWSIYIHGWATIGPDSTYDLSTWTVPSAPGGSLSVDSAPAAATIGVTGAVDVSWTGLTAGVDYLGAVSHGDGTNTLGFTLVDVTG